MANYSGTELPWTGGRPWRILDECLSSRHNTLNSARGRSYTRVSGQWVIRKVAPCVCPGARHAVAVDNAGRRRRMIAAAEIPATQKVSASKALYWVPDGVTMPDLSAGACTSMLGRRIMDIAIDGPGSAGVRQAKALCAACPLRESKCRPYILAAEQPAGSWRGVWAGMTQSERRKLASAS